MTPVILHHNLPLPLVALTLKHRLFWSSRSSCVFFFNHSSWHRPYFLTFSSTRNLHFKPPICLWLHRQELPACLHQSPYIPTHMVIKETHYFFSLQQVVKWHARNCFHQATMNCVSISLAAFLHLFHEKLCWFPVVFVLYWCVVRIELLALQPISFSNSPEATLNYNWTQCCSTITLIKHRWTYCYSKEIYSQSKDQWVFDLSFNPSGTFKIYDLINILWKLW